MKKLINVTDQVLTESLNGFVSAHADLLELGAEGKFVPDVSNTPKDGMTFFLYNSVKKYHRIYYRE